MRDEGGARERLASQIVVGADVVVAPTWLTHRRALLSMGETRRAVEWTAAAVRVARDAVEVGLERRAELLADAGVEAVAAADVGGFLNGTQALFPVYAYYSTTSNANAAAWLADGTASNAPLGWYTNVVDQLLSNAVSPLVHNTDYYYAYYY